MNLHCVRTLAGLVPSSDDDRVKLRGVKLGDEVCVEIRRPRNVRFHRKFFAMLNIVFDNLPDEMAAGMGVACVEDLLEAVKIDLGMYALHNVNGKCVLKTYSISFAKMDEECFGVFYDRAVMVVIDKYLRGATVEMLNDVVDEAVKEHEPRGGLRM